MEQFLDTAARWEEFPDVAHRCVLLAFDVAMLSGDRSLVARCQAIHEQIQEVTGEPPTWRLPMVEGLRNLAEGRLDERPADLRLFGARNRSEVVDTLIGAFATRYVEGPRPRSTMLDRELAVLGLDSDRTARLYGAFGRLMLAIGTPDELGTRRCRDGRDRFRRAVVGGGRFPVRGAATIASGLAGDREAARRRSTSSTGRGRPVAAVGLGLRGASTAVLVVSRLGSRAAARG